MPRSFGGCFLTPLIPPASFSPASGGEELRVLALAAFGRQRQNPYKNPPSPRAVGADVLSALNREGAGGWHG